MDDNLYNEFLLLVLTHRDWSNEYGERCQCGWEDKGGFEDWPEHSAKVLTQFIVQSAVK